MQAGDFVEADFGEDGLYYGTYSVRRNKLTREVYGASLWCWDENGADVFVPLSDDIPLQKADPMQHETTVVDVGESA